MRFANRLANQLRPISITRQYTKHAEGSVLIAFGETRVLCTASITNGVPRFLKGTGQGWVTAEYGMLPRATHERVDREAAKGKQSGRTLEIQRLIGRSLRAMVNLKAMGEVTITVDCDVLQADGGTRTASITGGAIALVDALNVLVKKRQLKSHPFERLVAAVSVGLYRDTAILDLDYVEDSNAETDLNVVMTEQNGFIEVQGTAEKHVFTTEQLTEMLDLAQVGIQCLIMKQREALAA